LLAPYLDKRHHASLVGAKDEAVIGALVMAQRLPSAEQEAAS
jgi:hypothetical protein